MQNKIHIIVSISISAVLLGLVVVKCMEWWMPTTAREWVLWVAILMVGFIAIMRIATLAKTLAHKDEE